MSSKELTAFIRHPAGRGIWLGLLCALVAWFVGHHNDVFRGLEDWLLDGCFCYRNVRPTQARIVIVGIDEASLHQLRKPIAFSSPELAVVVRYLQEQHVRAIGLDLFVPDSYRDLPEIDKRGGSGDAWALGDAARAADNVVLPQWWGEKGWLRPLHQWRRPDAGPTDVAFLNQTSDDDHFVRRAQLVRDGTVPHFALAVFAKSQQADFAWDDGLAELRVNGELIPLDDDGNLRINYVGPARTFSMIPFGEVLAAAHTNLPNPALHDAIVLVGITAWTDEDEVAVPYNNNYVRYLPGRSHKLMVATEVHANIISTLIDRAYIHTPPWLHPLPLLLLFGALLGAAYARLSPGWGILLAVGHHFAWKGLAVLAFTYANWRVEMVGMFMLGMLAFSVIYAARWRSLRRTLGVVKSEAVAQTLEQDPRQLTLKGKDCVVTVLFSDVRNFTTFAEAHPAQDVVTLLNTYFSAVVPEIEALGGTVVTFMGDGIMVLFGAPVDCPDHALQAVRAGLAMVRQVRKLREKWATLGCPQFQIGVGIHTGKVVVGSVGSPRRLDYTAIGDTVNVAARIEAENKPFGTEILISSATYELLPKEERGPLGCAATPTATTVKGKQERMYLYPVEVKDEPPPAA